MINWDTIQKIERVKARAHDLGFKMEQWSTGPFNPTDQIVLRPRDDKLPAYSRDADIHVGDLHSIDMFLRGIAWNQTYMELIRAADTKRVEKCEQDIRNRNLVRRLKDQPVVEVN